MFLKRIELSGFKSFADKTELEFKGGISAVVGPNGSGKSNISDSIRWVLGEQSAKNLRGGNMQDIIFAGSNSRKAVNYAEVSLTLDNADGALALDFSEVTVTRRLHRSGESEYFINKQACRLRDITELFMDTGIGKEAYSIIGQGRIEEILSTRSEDRRMIFEEASGIVKHKSRKKEAERKLEDTQQNLLRIHDLLSELDDQLEPLQLQAEKAKTYKSLKDELTSHDIALYVHRIEHVHALWKQETELQQRLEDEHAKWAAIVGQHDALLESDRQRIRQMDDDLQQLQTQLLHLSEEVEKFEGQGEVLRERERNLKQNYERLKEALKHTRERLTETESEVKSTDVHYDEVRAQLNEIASRLQEEEQRFTGVTLDKHSDEERLKGELLEVLNRAAHLRNDIRYAVQQMEALDKRRLRLQDEMDQESKQLAELSLKQEQLAKDETLLHQKQQETQAKFVHETGRLKEETERLQEAESTLRKWEQQHQTVQSRYEALKDMRSDYEGFLYGVKEVLKAWRNQKLKGIYGAVAELIAVPAKVELAIETALGGALQNIITADEASARAAIVYLKQRRAGRATFLPLNVIQPRFMNSHEKSKLEQMEGFIGIAADLVSTEPKFSSIVSNLLGHVLVTETLEQANRVARTCQYRYRVVTLEGDVVHAGGSMSGGSTQRKGSNLLGRQRQLDELEQQKAASEQQRKRLESVCNQLERSVKERRALLERLKDKADQMKIEFSRLQSSKQHLIAEQSSIQSRLAILQQDRISLEEEQEEYEEKKKAAELDLKQVEEKERSIQEQIREAEFARKKRESAKDALQAQLTDLKVQHASVSREKEAVEDQLRRLQKQQSTLQAEWDSNRKSIEQVEKELELNKQESITLSARLNELKHQRESCNKQILFMRADKAKSEQALQNKENETKDQRVQLQETQQQLHQIEVSVNRLDVQLDNLLKSLAEDYELSYELAKQRYGVPEDIAAAEQHVKDLKRRIADLGEVNLGAIDEYERVFERHEFLNKQYEDLVEAKDNLNSVIQEMDKEMSERFESTFTEIRSHFSTVFQQLFGGGRADLILTDPDHLLETGIEVVAQPPGKKLQNLQLLSGGERALTAIALLFAILNVKPVPFCVLDEVEAALDEANVSRFASYLREFSETTQFIVVTHRKGTMEEADVLYGVTMEEDGVSKLVSVKLDEDSEVITA